ncbi:DNA polymerase III subunit alpha [candidate division KSB1 bacterium]|nr:MAG: DNA polymerase III subunit alpha [candidate division KSB1 bacterium]MCE7944308.1 DNA polymerase III subunit alpha [Chlorobi bacterium CHB1]
MFPLLTAHSYYSFGKGVPSLRALCEAVRAQGYPSLAVTDINGIYGLVWFLELCREYSLKPIIGAEIQHNERAKVLVYNRSGYSNLCRIISARHLEEDFSLAQLASQREGLIVISDSIVLIEKLAQSGGPENLFIELRPWSNFSEAIRQSQRTGIPLAASPDIYFLRPEDFKLHQLLVAIHENAALSRVPENRFVSPQAFLKSPPEFEREFSACPQALTNARLIAETCAAFQLHVGVTIFPTYLTNQTKTSAELLRDLCYRGAHERYREITANVRERMEHELKVIISKGFADYFLVVREIVQQSPRTCGRGSVAASLVSYCLGITNVDPLAHNLYFERFLSPGRKDLPDADIDFAWDERDEILNWIFAKYGEAQAAMISNHVTLKTRSTIREVAKVFGLPPGEISRVTKKLSGWESERIAEIVAKHPVYRQDDFPPPWPEIFVLAERLRGTPRHMSVHSGGVVIALEGLDHHVPRQRAAKGVPIIQFEKDQAEDFGLVKIDVLGNRSLAVVRDALAGLKSQQGIALDYQIWNPIEDQATQALIRDGKAMGCFYIESPAMRLLFHKARRGDFETLIVLSSLIRPAANKYINMYVDRLHGQPYEPLHPLLAEVLKETFGVMVYQEDVSKTAIALADFSADEGEQLRKVLTKKHAEKRLADFCDKFFKGCRRRGLAMSKIREIWDMILSFSGYSFCKPHSASYAMLSFKCAWLKVHHPAIFMAAVISNQGGYYSTQAYLSECRRLGLEILPPDINHSEWKYKGEGKTVRVGLMQLKGVEAAAVQRLLDERQCHGPFKSFWDFRRRVVMAPSDMRVMIKAGLFDSVEPELSRPALIWLLRYTTNAGSLVEDDASWYETQLPQAQKLRDYSPGLKQQHEFNALGVLYSGNMLALFKAKIAPIKRIFAQDLPRCAGKHVQLVGWLVTSKLVRTANDEAMEFYSFEDETAIFETVFFPKVYRQFCHLMAQNHRPFLLRGWAQNDRGAISLNVTFVRLL